MAKITFEAGDVISFFRNESNSPCKKQCEYLGVCIDDKTCLAFLFHGDGISLSTENLNKSVGKIAEIPAEALPINIGNSIPSCWHQMFNALVEFAKWCAKPIDSSS